MMHIRSTALRPTAGALAALAMLLTACGTPGEGDGTATEVDEAEGATADEDASSADEDPTSDDADGEADAAGEDTDGTADDETDEGSDGAAEPVDAPAPDGDVRAVPAPREADCSAHGESVTVRPAGDVPDEVVATRELLIEAALGCDEQLLSTAIEESSMFTYSFGGGDDAIGYWRELEEAGEAPFLRLAQVLATTPAIDDSGDIAVFPRVATGRPEETTEEAWAELDWVDDREDVVGTGEGYLGWRVGISADGEWRFFVAGD